MSTSRALDMLARGMASCMYIEHGMRNAACMKACVTASQAKAKTKFYSNEHAYCSKRTEFWIESPSRSPSAASDIASQADTTVQV